MNKEQLDKDVRQFKAIKDHPKLKQWDQLIESGDKDAETRLRSTPRKKYEKHELYKLGEMLMNAGAKANEGVEDTANGENRIHLSRLQKIERIISGEGLQKPKKAPNIRSKNAKMWRDRQSLLERMRPSEYHEKVYQSVARK